MARQLGFLTPDPYIVHLSADFLAGAPKEAKDIISRSIGLNFGTAAVGDGYSVMQIVPRLSQDLRQTAAEIYAFDIMVQNFDRKKDNPNLLWNGKRIVLIDHESALNSIPKWPALSLENLALDKFYDHVFWDSPANADLQRLSDALQTLTPRILDGFFKLLPAVWRDEIALAKVREYLNFIVDNRQEVCELIHQRIS